MRTLRTFLRPGWIALAVVVVAFAALCFMLLAPWQLGKNTSTEHRNDLISSAVDTPAVPIDEVSPPGSPFVADDEWRAVSLTGRYLPEQQALVRLRAISERPAVEVLTPFAISGSDRVVLINRGFVRPEQGASIPDIPAPPSEETTIVGRIREAEGTIPGTEARIESGVLAVRTIDPADVARAVSLPLDPFYLQLSPDNPGSLGEIGLPQLDSGPYLSYGLQWLAFGIMAPLGLGYFIVSEVRHRRRANSTAGGADSGPQTEREASDDDAPATGASSAPVKNRRAAVREQLQRAGSASVDTDAAETDAASLPAGVRSSGIGNAPDGSSSSDEVRAKLARRYGSR